MTIERELLKEVLEYFDPLGLNTEHCEDLPERIKELLAQPEQPEQEPVAWIDDGCNGLIKQDTIRGYVMPLYTAPPKREPLGLEIMDACGSEDYREGFKDGALYAEKCHGIGGGE